MISVIIPTYNRAEKLQEALASVLQQQVPADEVIVVDDGSIDNTETMVKTQFPQVVYLRQENKGVSAARNLAITHASFDWIALLDSDDRWLPNKLLSQIRAIEENPKMLICHTDEIWIRNGVRVNPMKKHQKSGGDIFEQCLPLCCISPSSVIIKKDLFTQVGLFDESLPACEDYDMWLRICARHSVHYIDSPLIYKFGGHADQLSRKYWGMDRFRVRALAKLLTTDHLNAKKKQMATRMFEKKCAILEKGATKHNNHTLLDEIHRLKQGLLNGNR